MERKGRWDVFLFVSGGIVKSQRLNRVRTKEKHL